MAADCDEPADLLTSLLRGQFAVRADRVTALNVSLSTQFDIIRSDLEPGTLGCIYADKVRGSSRVTVRLVDREGQHVGGGGLDDKRWLEPSQFHLRSSPSDVQAAVSKGSVSVTQNGVSETLEIRRSPTNGSEVIQFVRSDDAVARLHREGAVIVITALEGCSQQVIGVIVLAAMREYYHFLLYEPLPVELPVKCDDKELKMSWRVDVRPACRDELVISEGEFYKYGRLYANVIDSTRDSRVVHVLEVLSLTHQIFVYDRFSSRQAYCTATSGPGGDSLNTVTVYRDDGTAVGVYTMFTEQNPSTTCFSPEGNCSYFVASPATLGSRANIIAVDGANCNLAKVIYGERAVKILFLDEGLDDDMKLLLLITCSDLAFVYYNLFNQILPHRPCYFTPTN